METAAKFARLGNRILGFIACIFILLLLFYGGYSLWDTYAVYRSGAMDDELLKFKPAEENEENPTLEELQQLNPDVRAWLTIDDTHIDYPVVQGETDMEYINKDVYGEFALSGAIFLSCLNAPDFSDSYNLIYGHHMESGTMFGDVIHFVDAEYFDSHTTGHLYLPDATFKIQLYACVATDAYDEYIYSPDRQSAGNMAAFQDYLRTNAVQYREIGITENDSIIGLSTCSESSTNGRIIIFGKLEKQE